MKTKSVIETDPAKVRQICFNQRRVSQEEAEASILAQLGKLPPSKPEKDKYPRQDEKEIGHHHGSGKDQADLLQSAQSLAGGSGSFYFGSTWQAAAVQAKEGEVKALGTDKQAPPHPGRNPLHTGGEHDVWVTADNKQVIKHTLPGFYGRTIEEKNLLDPRTFLNRSQLTLRAALPSEYLLRWQILNEVFGLPTNYLGRVGATEPRMAISQPFILQNAEDAVTDQDVAELMAAYGFTKVDKGLDAIPELNGVTWYRQKDGIILADTHARNFRKDATTGAIIPIDLMVTAVPKGASKLLPDPETEWKPIERATLSSAASTPDDQAALEGALRGLDPSYGDDLKASMASPHAHSRRPCPALQPAGTCHPQHLPAPYPPAGSP